jgi:hypothetical protein
MKFRENNIFHLFLRDVRLLLGKHILDFFSELLSLYVSTKYVLNFWYVKLDPHDVMIHMLKDQRRKIKVPRTFA